MLAHCFAYLLERKNLVRRGKLVDHKCGSGSENLIHILLECDFARAMEEASGAGNCFLIYRLY
jgi:hypothetical protein